MSPLFAACLPVLLLACGFALDVGMLQLRNQQMQGAADAAVIAAELELERNNSSWATEGLQEAAYNGYTNGANNTTVSFITSPVVTPANYGDYSGRYDVVQVKITQLVPTLFMGALTGGTYSVSAQAVAQIPPCIYLLNSKSAVTYTANEQNTGGPTYLYSDCPEYINGNAYSSSTNFHQAPETILTGASGSSSLLGTVKKGTVYGAAAISDPLASVTSPTFSGTCNHTSYSVTTGTVTLNPGTYCGTNSTKGMTLSNCTIVLNSGLYVITGGAKWTNVKMTGTGVTLFFTKGNGAQYGQFVVTTTSVINISAPTASSGGSLAGILFFADRAWVNTAAQDFNFNSSSFGTSAPGSDGIWYLPATGLLIYNIAWNCNNYCPIVADNLNTYNATLDPLDDFSGLTTGNPFRKQAVLAQ